MNLCSSITPIVITLPSEGLAPNDISFNAGISACVPRRKFIDITRGAPSLCVYEERSVRRPPHHVMVTIRDNNNILGSILGSQYLPIYDNYRVGGPPKGTACRDLSRESGKIIIKTVHKRLYALFPNAFSQRQKRLQLDTPNSKRKRTFNWNPKSFTASSKSENPLPEKPALKTPNVKP